MDREWRGYAHRAERLHPPERNEQPGCAAVVERLPDVATGRRLVHLPLTEHLDDVVGYLAVLAAGHVALVTGPQATSVTDRFAPDVRLAGADVEVISPDAQHLLHPDLALLLSTSGSTGSPKLVRLTHDNLAANAEGIATALELDADDRAITSLPLHYCYGLSVLHSHLTRGAGVVLTDLSVVDECFWRLCEQEAVTTLSGVPYTFELLDRVAPQYGIEIAERTSPGSQP